MPRQPFLLRYQPHEGYKIESIQGIGRGAERNGGVENRGRERSAMSK